MGRLSVGLRAYRSLPSESWTLLSCQFLTSATHFMAAPVLALHMAEHLELSASMLATVLSIHLISARALPLVTGPLADRFGPRTLMTIGLLLRAVGLLGFAVLTSGVALSVAALLMGLGTAAYESAVYGVFARHPQDVATRLFVLNNQALNLGVVLGPALGAGLLLIEPTSVFLVGGGGFIILACVVNRRSDLHCVVQGESRIASILITTVLHRRSLKFSVVCIPWWFLFSQVYVAFPLYAVRTTGEEASASLVFLVNGIAGTCFTIVSVIAFEKLTPIKILLGCYGLSVAAYLFVGAANGIAWFLIFIGIYTLVETLALPAIRSFVSTLATPGKESSFQGVQSLSWALGGSLGYYAGGWLHMNVPPFLMWMAFSLVAAVGLLSTLWFFATDGLRKR